jgi:hypothetical protein
MNVSWFTPYELAPELAVGAVLEAEVEQHNDREFIPIPLEPEHIDAILARGPVWLAMQLPTDFPVFHTLEDAGKCLLGMFEMWQLRDPDVDGMLQLVELYHGTWRQRWEYGYEIGPNTYA